LCGAFVLALFVPPTPPGPAIPMVALSTINWSGYALAGSDFTSVTGTFNVPVPPKSVRCLEQSAVWVGVDGLDNRDLLQAGVVESAFEPPSNPSQVEWSAPGIICPRDVQVYAFWEDLPSGSKRTDLPVKAGDELSVSIFKMSPGWWALAVHDISSGHSWLLSQPYSGPGTSVEWVVEAPQVMALVTDPIPFSTVNFGYLGAEGEASDLVRISFGSPGKFASSPDLVASTTQLMRRGFQVHWADVALGGPESLRPRSHRGIHRIHVARLNPIPGPSAPI
jgi:Peptidase A4 family